MKTYVINLKKDEEKLKRCMDSLKTINLLHPERFDAVYGKELDPEYVKKVVHPHAQHTIKNGRNIDSEIATMGAIGCSLSHISLWGKILKDTSDENIFLILEDDARPNKNTKERMDELLKDLPENWDIIMLGYNIPTIQENNDEKVGVNWHKIKSIIFGTHAYLINKKGANKLLKNAFPIRDQVDSYISYKGMMPPGDGIESYRPNESIFLQGNEATGIQTDTCIKCKINRFSDFEILLFIAVVCILILLLILFLLNK